LNGLKQNSNSLIYLEAFGKKLLNFELKILILPINKTTYNILNR